MVINPIIGFYLPIIRIPIKGGMTIPNIAAFDHGTDDLIQICRIEGIDQVSFFFSQIQASNS